MNRRRCKFDNNKIPNIREVCSVYFDKTNEPLKPHIHPQAMEICFIERGHQSYVVNGETYDIPGGGVFLTYPDEEHFGGWLFQEKCVLYYLIIDTVNNRDNFLGLGSENEHLAHALQNMPRTFMGNENLKILFESVFSIWNDSKNPLRTPMLKCAVFELMYEFLKCSKTSSQNVSSDIASILDYIEENITKKLPLSSLAEICGLSLAGFKRKFRNQMGISPGDYIIRRKIEYSKKLLLKGYSVTQTAFEMDFSSSQHFSSSFRKCCGVSPTQFTSQYYCNKNKSNDF